MAGLLMAALTVYPFQPHRWLICLSWVLILWVGGSAIWIATQVNRDAVVSALCGGTAGRIDWDRDMIVTIMTYAALPVAVLLAVQFPELGGYLATFVHKIAQTFK